MELDNSYASELLAKWAPSLVSVLEDNKIHVAQRLEAAYRRTLGSRGDSCAVQKEVHSLQREGYFRTENERKFTYVKKRPSRKSRYRTINKR